MTNRDTAVAAIRRLATLLECAPTDTGATGASTADQLIDGILDPHGRGFMLARVPDPSSTDGMVTICLVCLLEGHALNCPIKLIEAIGRVGIDSAPVVNVECSEEELSIWMV